MKDGPGNERERVVAFDDALGHSLPNQYLGNVKVGLQF